MSSIGSAVSEKMFENVDGQTGYGWARDAGVIGIQIAYLRAFGSGELQQQKFPSAVQEMHMSQNLTKGTFWQ